MRLSTKTKYMRVNDPLAKAPSSLQLRDLSVESVNTFTYLGSEINTTADLEATVKDRMSKAGNVFEMLHRMWTAARLPTRIKIRMYLTLVRPVALYGAETWPLLPSHEHLVDVADMRWLRIIASISLWEENTNEEVRRRVGCPVSMSEACRQQRLRYYGHLSRMEAGRAPLTALHKAAPGPRRQGRPTTTWLDLLHADAATRGLELADLTRLAADRDTYRQKVVYGNRLDGRPTRSCQ